MAHEVKVSLTEAQYKVLKAHAEKKDRSPAEDLVAVWWGRVGALSKFAERLEKGAKLRPYAPSQLSEEERGKLKAAAVKAGIALKPAAAPERKPREYQRKVVATVKAKGSTTLKDAIRGKPATKKVKPAHGIDLYDIEPVALAKARMAHDAGKGTVASILKAAGRNAKGKLVKS